jgi:hypothetical protein
MYVNPFFKHNTPSTARRWRGSGEYVKRRFLDLNVFETCLNLILQPPMYVNPFFKHGSLFSSVIELSPMKRTDRLSNS